MKKLMFALFLGLVLVLAACGGGDEGANDDNTNDETTEEQQGDGSGEGTDEGTSDAGEGDTVDTAGAEEVYQKNCASCHGGDLGGGMGPALSEVGSKYSAEEIVDIIKNGKGDMPEQGQVSDEDAQLVANWLSKKE
ncbi:cytochrome c551 [Halobacillus karajensis]|uniref:Cytochrome c551 n=1 Tax=Halobacillus karajensis TaxID=195088 RepID=A0A059NYV8_9BACI|nr:cytochrome c [Halobacillus karajensis]CDQ19224.1 Cytochrome c551 [Halobacillus karajensis]CDQ22702.1 Cytochrome c551 [Halobacillus karajensis]CDQ26184.1 Cytochrome c551 [Halobacillus karajensis]SEH39794.1 cytochrome c551 [Halobacillus karajensis]